MAKKLRKSTMVRIQLLILSFLLSTGAAAMPILTTDSTGSVTGATGLEYGGMTFAMEFVDGSCIDLFDGCDSEDDFIVDGTSFTHSDVLPTFFDAFISPEKLADDDSLDARPELAMGCNDPQRCITLAPAGLFDTGYLFAEWQYNYTWEFESHDTLSPFKLPMMYDSGDSATFNFATFTREASPVAVPGPASPILLALGLAGLGLRRMRRAV